LGDGLGDRSEEGIGEEMRVEENRRREEYSIRYNMYNI